VTFSLIYKDSEDDAWRIDRQLWTGWPPARPGKSTIGPGHLNADRDDPQVWPRIL